MKILVVSLLAALLLAVPGATVSEAANPGPSQINGAVGRLNAIATQLEVMRGRLSGILIPSPGPPEIRGAVGRLNAIATQLEVMHGRLSGILIPEPGPPDIDPGFAEALERVTANALLVLSVATPNPGPPDIDPGFVAAHARVVANAQAIVALVSP